MTAFLAGLLLGFVGSGHCAAMCGPLVVAAGPRVDGRHPASSGLRLLVYHAGRIATYLVLAVPAGLAGEVMSLNGLQRLAAVGGALVLVAAASGVQQTPLGVRAGRFLARAAVRSCSKALPWSRARPWAGPCAVGMANGLMPCGLVYAAATASAGTGSIATAVIMMAGFGVGTVPALVVVSATTGSLALALRARLARLAPLVLIVAAVLILVRAFDHPENGSHHGHAAAHQGGQSPGDLKSRR